MANLPLTGIRVLDATHFMQGPLGSQLLADLGAEVVRLEAPAGDMMRGQGGILFGRNIDLPGNTGLLFEIGNRNKKGLSLDLHKPEAREVVYRLAQKSDVMMTNFGPKSLVRFGIDEETIRGHNPDIVYLTANFAGSKGPQGGYPGNDATGISRSGLMLSMVGGDEPIYPPGALSDIISATFLGFAAVTALLARQRTGVAHSVECSQLGSMMWLQQLAINLFANKGVEFLGYDRKHGPDALQNVYRCKDGTWIALGLARSDADWVALCSVLGINKYSHDSRFATDAARRANAAALIEILDQAFAAKPRHEWDTALRDKGLCSSVVNAVPDLFTDPQVLANEYIGSYASALKLVNLPFQMPDSGVPPKGDSPSVGRDTTDILTRLCGYTWEEVGQMVSEGIV